MAQSVNSRLGIFLREAREARGVSLAQAAAETRIVQRYLAALELGEFHHLPGDVYARGFLRNYAQYLELPTEEVLELYRAERGSSAPIRVTPATEIQRSRSYFMPSIWAVVLVVTVLVVAGYLVLNALGITQPPTLASNDTPTPTVPTPSPLPTYTPNPTVTTQTPDLPVSPLDTPEAPRSTLTPTPQAPVVVIVRITEGQSWLQVLTDGQPALQINQQPFLEGTIVNAGWEQTFLAQQEVTIRAGNAIAVEVSFNGAPFSRLSQTPNDVVQQTYPAD